MNYYKRHIGDYYKKAGRLSMLEHGAYTILIDACYDREKFPTEAEAIDWCWAKTDEEIAAVRLILSKFFTLDQGIYVQNRISEELAGYRAKSSINQRIALKREEEKRTNRARTVLKRARIDHESAPNQEPITNNHLEDTNVSLSGSTRPSSPDAKEVLEFLNAKAGRNYRPTEINLKLIQARLKEGYTKQDCFSVVAKKCREWMPDDKMREYLRPATLFNREKFNQYIGEIVEE